MTLIEAAKQLKQRVIAAGGEWTADRFQWLAQRNPAGVPEDQLDAIVAELCSPTAGMKSPLRVVKTA